MSDAEILSLYDETRPAWGAEGPRPVRTHVWRPAVERAGRPLVVLSHGSGGAAVNLAWLAEALCAEGFLVAAVDHHRNTYFDNQHLEGFSFWWERAPDLSLVVDHFARTAGVEQAAVVGYSLGGYTAACVLGARIDAGKLARLHSGEPLLPIPPERPNIAAETAALWDRYDRDALLASALADYRDPRFVAGILLAPAICPILDDATLAAIDRPVLIRWGDADDVEAPQANGARYTRLIPGADGRSMGEHVGHFEFGGETEGGEPVRATVLSEALPFVRRHLGSTQR